MILNEIMTDEVVQYVEQEKKEPALLDLAPLPPTPMVSGLPPPLPSAGEPGTDALGGPTRNSDGDPGSSA